MHRQPRVGLWSVPPRQLIVHIGNRGFDLLMPFERLDGLLSEESSQDAKDDDAPFLEKFAPIVQQLRLVNVHRRALPGASISLADHASSYPD